MVQVLVRQFRRDGGGDDSHDVPEIGRASCRERV